MIARCSLLRPSLLAQALCLSLCALCGHAAAQETQATAPAKGEMATLDKVTVAATRYNATDMQMAATNTVNVLSADDLKTTAVHNVAEALGLPTVDYYAAVSGLPSFLSADGVHLTDDAYRLLAETVIAALKETI